MKEIKKRINLVYRGLKKEQDDVSSEFEYYAYDNPIMVDFGNLGGENTERDEWIRFSDLIKLYRLLVEKVEELKKSEELIKDYYSFIEELNLMQEDYVRREQYKIAGIILKWRKKLKNEITTKNINQKH